MKKIAIILLAGVFAVSSIPASAQVAGGGGSAHSSSAWWIMACPGGVVAAAMAKNWRRHKERNAQEAWTCGLLYWWNEGTGQYGR